MMVPEEDSSVDELEDIAAESPYSTTYCAEYDCELFCLGSTFFESLQGWRSMDDEHQEAARRKLRHFSKNKILPEASFLQAVYDAREFLRSSTVLWDEVWLEELFGNYHGPGSHKHYVGGDLFVLLLHSDDIVRAKLPQLKALYVSRKLVRLFKAAVAAFDPATKYPIIATSPTKAVRTAPEYRMAIFIVRTHMYMTLLGYADFDAMARLPDAALLQQKIHHWLSRLEASAVSRTPQRRAHAAEVPAQALRENASLSPSSSSASSVARLPPLEIFQHQLPMGQLKRDDSDDVDGSSDEGDDDDDELDQMLATVDALLEDAARARQDAEEREARVSDLRQQLSAYQQKRKGKRVTSSGAVNSRKKRRK